LPRQPTGQLSARLLQRRATGSALAYPRVMSARECVPEFIEPMLLTATETLPGDDGWVHEVKWDGMRAQLRLMAGG
jgi:bifunctional non-homologous end joining protein LigD